MSVIQNIRTPEEEWKISFLVCTRAWIKSTKTHSFICLVPLEDTCSFMWKSVCTLKAWYLLIFITLHIGRKWSQEQQSKTVLHNARKQQMPLWQKHPQSPFSFTNSCVHYSHTHQRHQRAAATKHWKEGWAHPLCSTELKPSQNGGCKFGRLCKTFINLTELSSPRMLLRWNILGKQLLLEHK